MCLCAYVVQEFNKFIMYLCVLKKTYVFPMCLCAYVVQKHQKKHQKKYRLEIRLLHKTPHF